MHCHEDAELELIHAKVPLPRKPALQRPAQRELSAPFLSENTRYRHATKPTFGPD
jgi:hypothetical protein